MLRINLQKILQNSTAENIHQLAEKIGFRFGNNIYKYSAPEKIKMMKVTTISAIAKEIALKKNISPLDVKMGDIFDWQEEK
jgi:hypothetical protein